MVSKYEIPGLRGRENRLSLTAVLEDAGLGADEIEEVVRTLTVKQRVLLLVFKKLVEFYMNAYGEALELYEVALRENDRLQRWVDARLPGEKDILPKLPNEQDDKDR
jgi:hypothetical protein